MSDGLEFDDPDISTPITPLSDSGATVVPGDQEVQPGFKTTEFYLTVILVLTSAVKVLGTNVSSDRIEALATLVVISAPGVIALIAYIRKRTEVKREVVRANAEVNVSKVEGAYGVINNNREKV